MKIQVEHLYKTYGGKMVLENLSAVFINGVTCVTAPSGSGKTTLLRLLLGLERPDSGVISGADCRWGVVFQEDRLLEDLSAVGNLRFVLGKLPQKSRAVLDCLGLPWKEEQPVRTWSGGMKRRLALARALLVPSEALALDEPFTGLDMKSRDSCVNLIREAGASKPVLLATHDLAGLEDMPTVKLGNLKGGG